MNSTSDLPTTMRSIVEAGIDSFRAQVLDRATVNVSPHLLADVLSCETLGWVRHAEGYCGKGESIKLVAGSAFHAGIAAHLDVSSAIAPLDAFRSVYEPAFAKLAADELPDQAYLPANLGRLVSRWIETHPPTNVPWGRVLHVEEGMPSRTFDVEGITVQLIVRPDSIVEDQFGRVRWMDTKTTGWRIADPGWIQALRLSLQGALYTDAVVQRYGVAAALGGWFNAVELRQLPSDPTRKCKEHGTVYAECGSEHAKTNFIECLHSPERIEAAVRDAERAAQKFVWLLAQDDPRMLDMRGTAHGACRFCANAAWCEADRLRAALPSFLKYDPWVISEGKR